jgi:large subunit ribosomal protein L30
MALRLKVTQVRSAIGRPEGQRDVLKGLGLRRLNRARVLPDNPSVRGMIRKIQHLVRVESVE